ncbi:MAG: DUF1573 domain-containing protein [Muribaculaceae bacterium]|nr:DUF1573 domain-containing protein [Muribaculaceae bacterium]MCF0214377.1 DUF1573 domain-containing protein [Muribaculaceae bacterium]
MKRILSLIMLTISIVAFAGTPKEQAVMTFEKTKIDLGNIKAADGHVTFEYPFTNTGNAPLVIVTVTNGGCGCTKPTYPKAPIMPGEKGVISITFDPTGRKGELNREIKVRSNAKKKNQSLHFKGTVIPPNK